VCERKRENLPRSSFLWGRRKKKVEEEKKTAVFFRLKRVTENRAFNCPLSRHPESKKKGKKYARARRGEANLSLSLSLSLSLFASEALYLKKCVFLLQMSKTKISFISSAKLSASVFFLFLSLSLRAACILP
jgi:hypothetical protein